MTRDELREALTKRCFQAEATKKIARFTGPGGLHVALKLDVKNDHDRPLVVDHRLWQRIAPPRGVTTGHHYHNSNLRDFPSVQHTGKGNTRHGIAVGVEDETALDALLHRLEHGARGK